MFEITWIIHTGLERTRIAIIQFGGVNRYSRPLLKCTRKMFSTNWDFMYTEHVITCLCPMTTENVVDKKYTLTGITDLKMSATLFERQQPCFVPHNTSMNVEWFFLKEFTIVWAKSHPNKITTLCHFTPSVYY
jgi:hypothetical protein